MTERPGFQVIPIDVNHIELLNTFKIKFCTQKATNSLKISDENSTEQIGRKMREFLSQNDVVMIDKIEKIDLINDRVMFNQQLRDFMV